MQLKSPISHKPDTDVGYDELKIVTNIGLKHFIPFKLSDGNASKIAFLL